MGALDKPGQMLALCTNPAWDSAMEYLDRQYHYNTVVMPRDFNTHSHITPRFVHLPYYLALSDSARINISIIS